MTRTYTKRLITKSERQASTVHAIAQRVTERWPKVEAVAAALAPPTITASGSHDGGRPSGHADPTARIALGHPGYDELREAVAAWLEQGKWIEERQIAYLKEHPELASAKLDSLKGLCHIGGCDFDAVRRGMCWHHYQIELDNEKTASHHTATTPVIQSATNGSPVSVEPELPKYTATMQCIHCGETFTADGPDDIQARGDVQIMHARHECAVVAQPS